MGRSPCCDNSSELRKGSWTEEEDLKLMQYIRIHGPGNWRTLPNNAGLQRRGKSCRLRWTNYLRPDIKRGRFSFEEEETIIQLHSVLGNKWSAIANRLPGRTDNEIKNYWNTHIRKRLLKNGIDPVTHRPRLILEDLSTVLNSASFNLSNLLSLQTLVNNPEVLRLLLTLLASSSSSSSSYQQNQELFLNNHLISTMNQLNPNHLDEQNAMLATDLDGQQFTGHMSKVDHLVTSQESLTFPSSNDNSLTVRSYNPQYYEAQVQNRSLTESEIPTRKNFNFDSFLRIPMSNDPTHVSPSLVNNSNGSEDERGSHCSNTLHFETSESFGFDDFM